MSRCGSTPGRGRSSDDIDDAVNYRTVAKAIIAHIEQGRRCLVERLAAELAGVCLAADPASPRWRSRWRSRGRCASPDRWGW